MVDADQIKRAIEKIGSKHTGKPFELSEVAKELDLANWEEIMERIRLVAEVLESQGLIRLEDDKITYVGSSKLS
jgi:hypothetical protein